MNCELTLQEWSIVNPGGKFEEKIVDQLLEWGAGYKIPLSRAMETLRAFNGKIEGVIKFRDDRKQEHVFEFFGECGFVASVNRLRVTSKTKRKKGGGTYNPAEHWIVNPWGVYRSLWSRHDKDKGNFFVNPEKKTIRLWPPGSLEISFSFQEIKDLWNGKPDCSVEKEGRKISVGEMCRLFLLVQHLEHNEQKGD